MKQILIIDDSTEDFELAKRAFLKVDPSFQLDWIDNGKAAFERIDAINKSGNNQICLILLDIKMHEIDGFDILTELKSGEQTRKTPVIMLSSSKMEKDIKKAFQLGANSYVQKPADFAEYNRIIHCVCDYWFNINSMIYAP